ncbi:MAG: DUF1043 family protein [Gammaproteobacteria bacterium]|nr:MAG: DUF1043 family protein [Gammaproteobacteria bacterium]
MDAAGNLWLVGVFCTALGALLGYAAALMLGPGGGGSRRDLESRLQQSRDELKNYQMEVNSHFTQTAELLNRLNENYREVHNHLAQGAQALCDRPGQPPLLQPLPEQDAGRKGQTIAGSSFASASLQAPLDYAPKATQHERGILREDFGLEKPSMRYEPTISTHYQLDDDDLGEGDDDYTGLSQSRNS